MKSPATFGPAIYTAGRTGLAPHSQSDGDICSTDGAKPLGPCTPLLSAHTPSRHRQTWQFLSKITGALGCLFFLDIYHFDSVSSVRFQGEHLFIFGMRSMRLWLTLKRRRLSIRGIGERLRCLEKLR
jgi:hypothetical protein